MNTTLLRKTGLENILWACIIVTGAIAMTGCSSTGSGAIDSVKKAFSNVGDSISSLAGGSSSKSGFVPSNFASDQVPHTLLKKPIASGNLTSGFGYRLSPSGVRLPRKHKGVDYFAPVGTPIYAAGDGKIVKLYVSESYGNYIRIEHSSGFATAYAHMHQFAEGLEVGSMVKKGQTIGTVGSTGRSTGPHLHYEMLYKGHFIDPLYE